MVFWGAWEGGSLWGCGRASLVGPCPSLTDSGDGIRALCLCPGSALFLRDPLLWGLTSGIVRHHPEPRIPQPLPQQRLLRVAHPAGGPGPQNPAPVYGCGVSLAGHWLWAWEWLRPRCGALAASAQALGRGGNAAGLLGLRLVQPVVQTDVPLPPGWKAAAAPTMPSRCSTEGPPRAGASGLFAATTIVSSSHPGPSSPSCFAVMAALPREASTPTTHHSLPSRAPRVRPELSFTLCQGRSSNSITKSFWWLPTAYGHPDPLTSLRGILAQEHFSG